MERGGARGLQRPLLPSAPDVLGCGGVGFQHVSPGPSPLSLYGGRGGDRQRKMCLRTKNWRRTLSDEAEGRKVGKASPLPLSRLRFAFCGAAITSLAFRPSVRVVRSRRHENLDAAGVTNGRQCGGAVVDPRIIGKVKPNLLSCQHSRSSHLRLGQLVNSNLLGGGRDIFRQRGPRLSRIPAILPSHCSLHSIR